VLLYVNILGAIFAVFVCALAPFADSIKKLVSTARAHSVGHTESRPVRHQAVRVA
jgi:hypothetical protein